MQTQPVQRCAGSTGMHPYPEHSKRYSMAHHGAVEAEPGHDVHQQEQCQFARGQIKDELRRKHGQETGCERRPPTNIHGTGQHKGAGMLQQITAMNNLCKVGGR
eukprot:1142218-Pelagomonas_calceolata.AAC.3